MKGIGIDITPIARIEDLLCRYGDKFRHKVLAEGEAAPSAESLAGVWAAKEAVVKALGTGYQGFGPSSLAIIKTDSGAPRVELRGKALLIAQQIGVTEIQVSISHAAGVAVACAIAL